MKGLKKFVSVLLSVMMALTAVPISALADEKTDMSGGNETVTWSYTAADDTLYINGEELIVEDGGFLPIYADGVLVQPDFSHLVIGRDVTAIEMGKNCFGARKASEYPYQTPFDITFEEGNALTEIGRQVFKFSTVTSVVFPESLENIGEFSFNNCANLETVVLPQNLKSVERYAFYDCPIRELVLPDSIKRIGDSAFAGCLITTLDFSENLTSIGSRAFSDAVDLEQIHFSEAANSLYIGAQAFWNTAVSEITIPYYVEDLKDGVFGNCQNLASVEFEVRETADGLQGLTEICDSFAGTAVTSLTLPETLTSFNKLTGNLSGMKKLESVDLSKTQLTKLPDRMFSGDVMLTEIKYPENLTEIGSKTFYNCTSLASVELPDTVTTVSADGYQFYGCTALEYVKLPDSLESIPQYCFYKCSSLNRVVLPSALKEIGAYGFFSAAALHDLDVPDTVEVIGANAFHSSAVDFNLPANLKKVGSYAFTGSGLTKAVFQSEVVLSACAFSGSDKLKQVVLPEKYGSTVLDKQVFYNCASLESVSVSANIEKISDLAFRYCHALSNVVFAKGSKLEEIGAYAFHECTSLEKITLPSTVEIIDDYAFDGCSSLKFINLEDTKLTVLYNRSFRNTGLEHVNFPDTLTGFRTGVFCGSQLTSLELSAKINSISPDVILGCPITRVTVYNPNFNFETNTFSGTDTEIRGFTDSTAQTFAEANGMTFIALDSGTAVTPGQEDENTTPTYGTFSGGSWIVTSDKELVISGSGEIENTKVYDKVNWIYTYSQIVNLNGVKTVTVGDGITSLPDNFLYDTSFSTETVETVNLPDTLVSIGKNAFRNSALSYIDIPNSVTAIGDYAFYNAGLSGGVTLSESLTAVNSYAFANNDFTSVYIPESVTSIGLAAFNDCENLQLMTIPKTVTSINEGASATKPMGFTSAGKRIDGFTIACEPDSRAYQYAYSNHISISLDLEDSYISGYYSSRSCAKWYYDPDTKALYFVTCGVQPSNATFYYNSGTAVRAGELDVDELIVCYGVTDITGVDGKSVFAVLDPNTITLPQTLVSIGDNAFSGLTDLRTIALPDSLTSLSDTAFADCNIQSISFGNGLKTIPDSMFENNKTLKYIDLGGVSTVGKNAFRYCTALEEVTIPGSLTTVMDSAFEKCLSLKSVSIACGQSITLYEKAFADLPLCDTIKFDRADISYAYANADGTYTTGSGASVDETVTQNIFRNVGSGTTGVCLSLGSDAEGCDYAGDLSMFNGKNIAELKLGGRITALDNMTSFPNLKTISVSENSKNYFSYDGCLYSYTDEDIITLALAPATLTEVEIYEGTRWIGDYAFAYGKIEHFDIPEGVTIIGEGAFYNCAELKRVTFPKTLEGIYGYAFYGCTKLKAIDIPSAYDIYDSAFENCTSLASVTLPDHLDCLSLFAFAGCASLTCIVMPNHSQAYIDWYAFENSGLKDIYLWDNYFEQEAFQGCGDVMIHTLAGTDSYALAREYGFNCEVYTDENVFADQCEMMKNIYEGYLGFCDDGHGDIEYLTVYEATCRQDGYIIGVCEYCSVILEEIHVDATGHKYEKTVSIEPTAATAGMEKYTCSACGDSYCEYTVALDGEQSEKVLCNITGTTVIANSKSGDSGVTPLQSVSVKLNGETLATTGTDGRFSFKLETGVYELVLWYDYGFERTVYLVVTDRDIDIGSVALIACDWNKDGSIDDKDMELFKFVISSKEGDPAYLDFVDMNHDGKIDVRDLVYMNYVKGLDKSSFEYPIILAE